MSNFDKLKRETTALLTISSIVTVLSGLIAGILLALLTQIETVYVVIISFSAALLVSVLYSLYLRKVLNMPYVYLLRAGGGEGSTPQSIDLDSLSYARDITGEIISQIIQLADKINQQNTDQSGQLNVLSSILNSMNFPVFGLNSSGNVVYTNQTGLNIAGKTYEQIKGQEFNLVLPLEKDGQQFVDTWRTDCQKNKITDDTTWQNIKISAGSSRQTYSYDVVGHFERNSSAGVESIIVLIDRTAEHQYDDMKVDFVAVTAHELRTPITILRGYMEAFAEELEPAMNDEQKRFLEKMQVSASQLSDFITNILNVAKVDKGALQLHFEKHPWNKILKTALDDLSLRAEAHGKKLEVNIEESLPEVAVDPISIVEVINNLVDNAIKYSAGSDKIIVKSYMTKNNMIETTVQDFGIGMPTNLVGKLFTKFYRSHRSKQQFGGSGLGLYLSKAIIDAHKGNIWAKSKEGEGSTFGFDLPKYADVADSLASNANMNNNILRGSHGWIKNHSMYRD